MFRNVLSNHVRMIVFLSSGLLVVLGWHFATVFGLFGTAPVTRADFFVRMGIIFVAFFVVSAVVAVVVASRDESAVVPDEREEIVELKAERYGLVAIYLGLFVVMWFGFTPLSPMQMANGILGVLCVGEIVKIVFGLLYLRRGA